MHATFRNQRPGPRGMELSAEKREISYGAAFSFIEAMCPPKALMTKAARDKKEKCE